MRVILLKIADKPKLYFQYFIKEKDLLSSKAFRYQIWTDK